MHLSQVSRHKTTSATPDERADGHMPSRCPCGCERVVGCFAFGVNVKGHQPPGTSHDPDGKAPHE